MGARNTQRARSPSTASPCGFSALGRDHSGAAGIVNFSDMLTSCLKVSNGRLDRLWHPAMHNMDNAPFAASVIA